METSCPASPTEQGILFQSRHGEGAGLYHTQVLLDVARDIDPDLFRRSWAAVAARHAALRTCFPDPTGEGPSRTVLKRVEVPLVHEDWRGLDEEQVAERRRALLREDHERGFALDRAPLWRLHVARLEQARYQVLWSLHYVLTDGRGQETVLREVERTYGALLAGTPLDLPAPTPFEAYADWRGGQDSDRAEAFWREELREAEAADPLPVESPAPAPA
ncbi:condensation domain-containing protein, partial [Streptomyces ardesiacus]|uniref:condensation domain-containing protein n=1 Tax=Streptomyces ardesiacus TaxID=285564 RepID=UPI003656AA35